MILNFGIVSSDQGKIDKLTLNGKNHNATLNKNSFLLMLVDFSRFWYFLELFGTILVLFDTFGTFGHFLVLLGTF